MEYTSLDIYPGGKVFNPRRLKVSNIGKELRKAGEELREAGLRAAMSLELFVVTWKWMRKITGIREF